MWGLFGGKDFVPPPFRILGKLWEATIARQNNNGYPYVGREAVSLFRGPLLVVCKFIFRREFLAGAQWGMWE